ncbi:hypothetical protein BGX21_000098 [Mortierella sp. AD011]|nr:hypothetical protein BGX20_011598 [Mortierella sp. AD010]KAF9389421.1 hypothetical protein BGX21_000098 [Mortierella sp. AD011]
MSTVETKVETIQVEDGTVAATMTKSSTSFQSASVEAQISKLNISGDATRSVSDNESESDGDKKPKKEKKKGKKEKTTILDDLSSDDESDEDYKPSSSDESESDDSSSSSSSSSSSESESDEDSDKDVDNEEVETLAKEAAEIGAGLDVDNKVLRTGKVVDSPATGN